ncbi:BgTH12-00808 [Blumeria graminis f. sp. triticale]|uniref:Diphosphomevalonate decarboxylase n=3 Tax=Blumeria graminis TaxID=34373 RepID=A0A381LDS9_BLUGR|nr:Mevalonate pyrophosphate decarboxylase [Blumeria graminis f. sp. tritici 96224]CAD6505316.1 BgTH12-00808 [Blumeria graminis f. sp. triticale]VDB93328.1 Bgt-1380 [Blumeria graminis f. sp. tritici]
MMTEPAKLYQASVIAPVNIAVVKYWGKRDSVLNLPCNSSISVTLSQDDLRTHTTASCSPAYDTKDNLVLNSAQEDITGARTQACLRELRRLRAILEDTNPSLPKLSTLPLRIVSENNFPTAAGLASSASGFAALVSAIAYLYELPSSLTDLSRIARQGSGSACRSLFGGYVAWYKGMDVDGSDSIAVNIKPASHWPTMRALILVVSAAKKNVSSTTGMQTTVATSQLFKYRADEVVPHVMTEMTLAIRDKDFHNFARLTMSESNNFHATCLDTSPPIFYLNDTSRAAIRVVEDINQKAGRLVAAYTFDAGPNAVIYYQESDENLVAGTLKSFLANVEGWEGKGEKIQEKSCDGLSKDAIEILRVGVSRVILTGVGEGPRRTMQSLISVDALATNNM